MNKKTHKTKGMYSPNIGRMYGAAAMTGTFSDFRCAHCKAPVLNDPDLSAVWNRNHCPYCLYSRHLDLNTAGDRLSACKAKMRPVGLTLKKGRSKYAGERAGELMLVHECEECGKVSINRLAADDDVEGVLRLFEASARLSPAHLQQLAGEGISALGDRDAHQVKAQLFGSMVLEEANL